jgi:2-C-methyl-D-erythritol 2,4-cyclodiphosphate synthase
VTELSILIACAGDETGSVGDVLRASGVTPDRVEAVYALGRAAAPAAAGGGDGAEKGAAPPVAIRSGIGYDSHRFAPGGPLILGGVSIPSDVHLAGHSDGDAVAHAITDAVLGAAGAGDIGEMFSDQDPANRGRDSVEMLRAAVERVRARGLVVHQVDVTVVAERPRVGPHRDAMRERLASALGVGPADVSVKGKTNEGMGWVGRGEGLACIAVATLAPAPAPAAG